MNKTYSRIINEEINKYVDQFEMDSPKQIASVLNELFTLSTSKLMDNIGSVEADNKKQVAVENWDTFIDSITESIEDAPDEWLMGLSKVKLKILTYKYFTRKDMIEQKMLDSWLRTEIKIYFTALQNYVDSKDFMLKFFNLPTEVLYNLVRYLFTLNDSLKTSIKVTNEDLRDNIPKMLELRMKVAEKVSKASKGYIDLIDLKELKELYDNGVLFEDTYLNRGINEFVVKMMNHVGAMKNIMELWGGSTINDFKKQAENSAAYVTHVSAIRNETDEEYFASTGEQIGKRFDDQLDAVREQQYDGLVVDKKSRLKEPNAKINTADKPWESNTGGDFPGTEEDMEAGGAGGGGGGASGGGGSFGGGGLGNGDFGGEFAPPGEEGEVPGAEGEEGADGALGQEPDGTPMPDTEEGMPEDFGTVEDNTTSEETPEETPKPEEKK